MLLLTTLLTLAQADDTLVLQRLVVQPDTLALLVEVPGATDGDATAWSVDDVTVTVDGTDVHVQEAVRFVDSGVPFATMMFIDASITMAPSMADVKSAATTYIDGMDGGHRANVAWFHDHAFGVDQPFIADKAPLKSLVGRLEAKGKRTYIYASLHQALDTFDNTEGIPDFRSILLLSDGVDEGSNTQHNSFERVIRRSVDMDVPINVVRFVADTRYTTATQRQQGEQALKALSADSGGRYLHARNGAELSTMFQQLQQGVHNLLYLEIAPHDLTADNHQLTVTLGTGASANTLTHRLELNAPFEGRGPVDDNRWMWGLAGGGGLLALLGIGAIRARRTEPEPVPVVSPPQPIAALESVVVPMPEPREPTRERLTMPDMPTPPPRPPTPAPTRRPSATVFRPPGSGAMTVLDLDGFATIPLFDHRSDEVIGSDPSRCDRTVAADTISGRHLQLTRRPDGSIVAEDLGSTNGTFIDGVDIRGRGPVPLSNRRSIQLGTARGTVRTIG